MQTMNTRSAVVDKSRARTEADKLKAAGINASRANLTLIEPEALTLIWDQSHPLYDARVELPVDPTSPLYQDIKARGVEKPIEVRKNGEKDGRPILQVIDGRQRVQILLHLNMVDGDAPRRKIPCNFVTGDDRAMVLRGLSSNLLRVEETPLTKAVKMHKATILGCGIDEIARACNLRTVKIVEEHLLILNFVSEVQTAFNGELPAGAIKTFAKVPREEQLACLETIRAGGAKTNAEVKAAVKAARNGAEYVKPMKVARWKPDFAQRIAGALKVEEKRLSEMVDLLKVEATSAEDILEVTTVEKQRTQVAAATALLDYLLGAEDALNPFPRIQHSVLEAVRG